MMTRYKGTFFHYQIRISRNGPGDWKSPLSAKPETENGSRSGQAECNLLL
jgi:hypothetical protein